MRSGTCGHPPPLLLRANHVVTLEASQPAPPLGLAPLLSTTYCTDTFSFCTGDTLLLYTDGVIEARNAIGAFYPLVERLTTRTDSHSTRLLDHIRDDLLTYVGGQLGDDAAMIVVERNPFETDARAYSERDGSAQQSGTHHCTHEGRACQGQSGQRPL